MSYRKSLRATKTTSESTTRTIWAGWRGVLVAAGKEREEDVKIAGLLNACTFCNAISMRCARHVSIASVQAGLVASSGSSQLRRRDVVWPRPSLNLACINKRRKLVSLAAVGACKQWLQIGIVCCLAL